ncbi:MAG TPA: TIGR00725 family protein [Syntrophaceae bacterium]|nr:TIGR00725 family protein [Syntrophaceae bacterium]
MRKTIIGVMGGGDANKKDIKLAYDLGALIAKEGWVLLNGGRSAGIMEASSKGCKEHGGITVGILPGRDSSSTSKYIDIQILTGMGDARNYINVLSSDVVIACKGGAGTISEIALALKNGKKVILLDFDIDDTFEEYRNSGLLLKAQSPEEAIKLTKNILSVSGVGN